MTLKTRLLGAFLGIGLLTLLAGGTGIVLIERISASSSVALQQMVPLRGRVMELLLTVESTIVLSRGYVINLDPEQAERIHQQIKERGARVDQLIEALDGGEGIATTEVEAIAALHHDFVSVKMRLIDSGCPTGSVSMVVSLISAHSCCWNRSS